MTNDGPDRPRHGRFRRAMRTPVLGNSEAFGYSITITVTFGVVSRAEGSPRVPELLLFGIAAALSIGIVEAVATRGFRERVTPVAPEVRMMGTALGVISVAAAVAAAFGIVRTIGGMAAWTVAPFAASIVFIAMEIVETLLAEIVQERRGDTDD